jgi:hypothetical protein
VLYLLAVSSITARPYHCNFRVPSDYTVCCEKYIFYGVSISVICGPDSSVGIATSYGLDGPGIESRWDRDFPHLIRPALGPTQPPVQWVPGLSRGKERPGRDADPLPLLVTWS